MIDWKKNPNYMYFLWYIYLFCRKIRLLVNNTDVLYHRFVRYYIYMYIYCNWNRRGIHCIVCWPQRLFTYVYLYAYGRIILHASQVKNITDNHFSKILLSSFYEMANSKIKMNMKVCQENERKGEFENSGRFFSSSKIR